MQKIGPCKFSELPQGYQDQFESGTNQAGNGQFFAYKFSDVVLLWAFMTGGFYLLPALLVIGSGPYYFYRDPTIVSRVISDMGSGLFQFGLIILLVAMIAWGLYYLITVGLTAIKDALAWARARRAATAGTYHYGLLIDRENLVLRQGEDLGDYECVFLPKRAIRESFVGQIRIRGAKRSYYVDVVKLRYLDEHRQRDELALRDRFSMSIPEMNGKIQQWLQLQP